MMLRLHKQILFPLLFTLLFSAALQAQRVKDGVKTASDGHFFHWMSRGIGCNISCLFGDCDRSDLCEDYLEHKAFFASNNIEQAFYISKDRKWYLKKDFKRLFTSDNAKGKNGLLSDKNDRVIISLYGLKPIICEGTTSYQVIEFKSRPLKLSDFNTPNDVYIGKVPSHFPTEVEIGVRAVRHCKKSSRCVVWSPYDRLYKLNSYIESPAYPPLPLLIDTLSSSPPAPYKQKKAITFTIPFEPGKSALSVAEVQHKMEELDEAPFSIEHIEVMAYPPLTSDSLRGRTQTQQQAQSLINLLKAQTKSPQATQKIVLADTWLHFKQEVSTTLLYYLADSSVKAVRSVIEKDKNAAKLLSKVLEAEKQAVVKINVSFDPTKYDEKGYWLYKIEKAINKHAVNKAQTDLTALINLLEEGKLERREFLQIPIPRNPYYVMLLNNQCAYAENIDDKMSCMDKLTEIDENNPLVKYNLLALHINKIGNLPAEEKNDSMLNLLSWFNGINESSVPPKLYSTLEGRFYPYVERRKPFKIESLEEVVKNTKENLPNEALMIADLYARNKRYDIAAQLLLDHYDDVNDTAKQMVIQYSLRMLQYGKLSGNQGYDYEKIFNRLKKADGTLFCKLFKEHTTSFLFLGNLNIRQLYCQECMKQQ